MSNGIRPVLYNYIYIFTVCKFNLFAVVPIVGSTHSRDVHKGSEFDSMVTPLFLFAFLNIS